MSKRKRDRFVLKKVQARIIKEWLHVVQILKKIYGVMEM